MLKTLMDLYHNSSDQRKLALKDKLRKINMEKGETIPKYLTKFTQCRDELGSVGIIVSKEDMVSLSLLGLPKSWHSYQDSVNGQEKLLDWERLWSDLMQDEIKRNTRDGSSSNNDDEENCALAIKARKGKGKISCSKSDSYHGGKKKDMTKVKLFHCHKMGHFATNYPLKKSKEKSSMGAAGGALASQFELDFSLIACMVYSVMGSVWYLDSGASFHMTGDKELFSELEEKDLKMHLEMGDDGKYSVTGVCTITFHRKHAAPLTLKNVMHVPGLTKNLVSIAMLEDKGYDVIFSKGKAFLRHIARGQVKKIGIRVQNLYKIEVENCVVLSSKVEKRKDQTFTNFCEFKALVKKESGKKVKALRSDNSGEYVSNEFKNFCAVEGIKRELMATHNPQQNWVAKRKNKSIVGATKAMLHDQGLPLHLWVEACNIAVYVQNHSPH
eukprot:PITA_08934